MATTTPIVLPPVPRDSTVTLPAPPVLPPTVENVLAAVQYRKNVERSIDTRDHAVRCTDQDHYNAILYEHNVVGQAAAAASPQAVVPSWFQAAAQQMKAEIWLDIRAKILQPIRRLTNKGRSDGTVVSYVIVPFINGEDPTQPPNNLPPLHSVKVINNLSESELIAYLNGYGMTLLPPDASIDINCWRKQILKWVITQLERVKIKEWYDFADNFLLEAITSNLIPGGW